MNRPRSRVPMWVRTMRPGLVRSYLIAVFLGPTRVARRDLQIW